MYLIMKDSYFFQFEIYSVNQIKAYHHKHKGGSGCNRSVDPAQGFCPQGSTWCSSWQAVTPLHCLHGAHKQGHESGLDAESETYQGLYYLFDSEKLRESDQENMFSQVLWNHLNLRVANLRGLWVFCLFVGV